MGNLDEIAQALTAVLKLMLERPEEMSLRIMSLEASHVFRISVSPKDVGFLIGKQGRTARSIRVLLGAMASTAKLKISLDIETND